MYSSTKNMRIFDPVCWKKEDATFDADIIEGTKRTLRQIEKINVDKEIILLDNTGDFPKDFKLDSLQVVPSFGAWSDEKRLENIGLFSNIKDKIPTKIKDQDQNTITAVAYNHGISIAKGDYFIIQHNDICYLDKYYKTEKLIEDVVNTLEKEDYEYITIDKKPVKNGIYKEVGYFADCYWFLCRKDFYTKHNIWIDWKFGDNNHLATITCYQKKLKYLHLPGFYENYEQSRNLFTHTIGEKGKFNIHLFNDKPFLVHAKGGTGLKLINKVKKFYDTTN